MMQQPSTPTTTPTPTTPKPAATTPAETPSPTETPTSPAAPTPTETPEETLPGPTLPTGTDEEQVEALMIAFSTAILLKSDSIISIFTSEPDLVELGGIFLRIGAAGYLLLGSVLVLQDSIAGAGDTIPTMIVSIAMIWGIQLPLAFFLPRFADLGVLGVRWAMVISIWCGAAFYIIYFIHGRWKVKKV